MLFNSFQFLIFFPIVLTLYFLLPFRYRTVLLLASSYFFYMCWKAQYIVLILISTIIDYFAALCMGTIQEKRRRKAFLLLSLLCNLGLLFIFKYYNFFDQSLQGLLSFFHIPYTSRVLDVVLPVGISFYTFQTLSYTIDVYRGKQKPMKNFITFALYVAYFPQLVAGPIERSSRLLPQLCKKHMLDIDRIINGMRIVLWGFFKKIVIADRLSPFVDVIYSNPEGFTGVHFVVATVFFSFQIYCDFSGYSDIAIGISKIMGIDLMINFKTPYFSKSISEFWKRWHISLSTWFRDYLYIPLGGNKVRIPRWYLNLFIVFVISGFWHGANWTFLIWGGIHGFYLVFSILSAPYRESLASFLGLIKRPLLHKSLKVLITYILVCISWIFFRADSMSDALYILTHLFDGWGLLLSMDQLATSLLVGMQKNALILAMASILFLLCFDYFLKEERVDTFIGRFPLLGRWALYLVLSFGILNFGSYAAPFIYFQF